MELLQSQAPVDWELSGSSASARHGNSDIGDQTSDMGHGTQEFGNIEEKLFEEGKKKLKNCPKIGMVWYGWRGPVRHPMLSSTWFGPKLDN